MSAFPAAASPYLRTVPGQLAQPLPRDLVAEPIIGWRVWRVVEPVSVTLSTETISEYVAQIDLGENPLRDLSGVFLCPISADAYWHPKPTPARCLALELLGSAYAHVGAPSVGCDCGYWAMKDETLALSVLERCLHANPPSDDVWAWGRVELWGHVIEQQLGWRAEFARPYDVQVHGGQEIVESLRARYPGTFRPAPLPAVLRTYQQPASPATIIAAASFAAASHSRAAVLAAFPVEQSEPEPPKKRRWPWRLLAAGAAPEVEAGRITFYTRHPGERGSSSSAARDT